MQHFSISNYSQLPVGLHKVTHIKKFKDYEYFCKGLHRKKALQYNLHTI